MEIDLVTYCCPKDAELFHAPGALERMVASHGFPFSRVLVVQQDCRGFPLRPFGMACELLETEDFPGIRPEFGIPECDPTAEALAPRGTKYFWENHCQNQLIGLKMARTGHAVFADCDIEVRGASAGSWVREAVAILERDRKILMVSPGHGGPRDETDVVSQIVCCFHLERMRRADFDLPGKSGPFDYVWEGRVQRFMRASGLRRVTLGPEWGVIHHHAW